MLFHDCGNPDDGVGELGTALPSLQERSARLIRMGLFVCLDAYLKNDCID